MQRCLPARLGLPDQEVQEDQRVRHHPFRPLVRQDQLGLEVRQYLEDPGALRVPEVLAPLEGQLALAEATSTLHTPRRPSSRAEPRDIGFVASGISLIRHWISNPL